MLSVDKNGIAANKLDGTVPLSKLELTSKYLRVRHNRRTRHINNKTTIELVAFCTNVMSRKASHSRGIVPDSVFSVRDSDLYSRTRQDNETLDKNGNSDRDRARFT
jgi:hypothetical protein